MTKVFCCLQKVEHERGSYDTKKSVKLLMGCSDVLREMMQQILIDD